MIIIRSGGSSMVLKLPRIIQLQSPGIVLKDRSHLLPGVVRFRIGTGESMVEKQNSWEWEQ